MTLWILDVYAMIFFFFLIEITDRKKYIRPIVMTRTDLFIHIYFFVYVLYIIIKQFLFV